MIAHLKKEVEGLKINKKTLRNFGILFFFVFCMISLYAFRKDNIYWTWLLFAGIFFLAPVLWFQGY